MKTGIMNLRKWAVKTAGAVERICQKKQAPCVGFSLVFFDPLAGEEERWNYVIQLAFDPHNPPPETDQEQLQQAFEFINEGVRRIMCGEPKTDDLENHTREVRWH